MLSDAITSWRPFVKALPRWLPLPSTRPAAWWAPNRPAAWWIRRGRVAGRKWLEMKVDHPVVRLGMTWCLKRWLKRWLKRLYVVVWDGRAICCTGVAGVVHGSHSFSWWTFRFVDPKIGRIYIEWIRMHIEYIRLHVMMLCISIVPDWNLYIAKIDA